MPEITADTSIYNKLALPKPMDLGHIVGTANALNQNQLFGQEFAARKSIGNAYQQAIDPQTGRLDTNKLMGIVANDPAAAFKTGEVAQQALGREQTQLEIDMKRLEFASNHLKSMNNTLSGLLADPNLTSDTVISRMGDLVAEGRLSPQIAAQELSSMPRDPQALRNWVTQHMVSNLGSQEQLGAIFGQISNINTGGKTSIVASSPVTGAKEVGSLQNTMSPDTASSPVPAMVKNPDGTLSPSNITRKEFAGQSGGVATAPALSAEGLTPEQRTAKVSWFDPAQKREVSGTMEQFLAATGNKTAPNGQAPAKAQAPAAAGPALGEAAAADVTGKGNAEMSVDMQKAADQVPQRKSILGNLEAALDQFTSGPGADWKKVGKAFVNSVTPYGNVFDPKSIASQEEFGKQALQLAQAQFQALGGTGTDSKLESTMKTSPNEALTKLGNKGIIHLLKGNEDAIAVMNQAWQSAQKPPDQGGAGYGPQDYGKFKAEFNKVFDPRVFQSAYLDDQSRGDMLKGMTDAEKKKFAGSIRHAIDSGWVKPQDVLPGLSNGQP